ncbi:MAG: hypothetical protein ACYCSQ_00265 [bacterium]
MIFTNTELDLRKRKLPNGSDEFYVGLKGESEVSIPVSREAVYVDDDGDDSLKSLSKLTLSTSSAGRLMITPASAENGRDFVILSSESDKDAYGSITVLSGGRKIMSGDGDKYCIIECDGASGECVVAVKKGGYKVGLFVVKDGTKTVLRNREIVGYYESLNKPLPVYITPNLNGRCSISLN